MSEPKELYREIIGYIDCTLQEQTLEKDSEKLFTCRLRRERFLGEEDIYTEFKDIAHIDLEYTTGRFFYNGIMAWLRERTLCKVLERKGNEDWKWTKYIDCDRVDEGVT